MKGGVCGAYSSWCVTVDLKMRNLHHRMQQNCQGGLMPLVDKEVGPMLFYPRGTSRLLLREELRRFF